MAPSGNITFELCSRMELPLICHRTWGLGGFKITSNHQTLILTRRHWHFAFGQVLAEVIQKELSRYLADVLETSGQDISSSAPQVMHEQCIRV